MPTLTVRGLSDETVQRLKREADAAGTSVNKLIVSKLEGFATGSPFKPRTYHELDHLFGTLSAADARALDKSSRAQRRIDKELWQ
jgi:hypothetical protein